jgi:hypothetical protein
LDAEYLDADNVTRNWGGPWAQKRENRRAAGIFHSPVASARASRLHDIFPAEQDLNPNAGSTTDGGCFSFRFLGILQLRRRRGG